MSYGSGSLTIAARRSGPRTVLDRVRYDGISRCSRAFAHGNAALVVLSQLGPGVVRGDSITTEGHVHADAHLVVTSQSATRLMGGPRIASARAHWRLEDRAVLELIGEPLVASTDARYETTTTIELGPHALVLVSEIAAVPTSARVRLRTSVRTADRELLYDAFDAAAAAPHVVGTFALVGADAESSAALVDALDAAAFPELRIGIGRLAAGAFVRILGQDIWLVRTALGALRAAAWAALAAAQSATCARSQIEMQRHARGTWTDDVAGRKSELAIDERRRNPAVNVEAER